MKEEVSVTMLVGRSLGSYGADFENIKVRVPLSQNTEIQQFKYSAGYKLAVLKSILYYYF
jgi:hypothetical protein